MFKNKFDTLIFSISLGCLSSINCMQAPVQTGQLMQLPEELRIKIMVHIVDGKELDERVISPEERAKAMDDIRQLARTCSGMYILFMQNGEFARQLITIKFNKNQEKTSSGVAPQARLAVEVGTPAAKAFFDNLFGNDFEARSDFFKNELLAITNKWCDLKEKMRLALKNKEEFSADVANKQVRLTKYTINKLVQWGHDLNTEMPGGYGNKVLTVAAVYNDKDYMEFLLNNGAMVNAKGARGNTALGTVVDTYLHSTRRHPYSDTIAIIQMLIERGGDPNIGDDQGKTPLQHALWGSQRLAKFLIENGALFAQLPKATYQPGGRDETAFEFVCRHCSASHQAVDWLELKTLMQSKQSNSWCTIQ